MDQILTMDELAAYLKVPKSSLYKLVQAGKVPGTKVGRHWRFSRDTIDAWLAAGAQATIAHAAEEEAGNGEGSP